MGGGREWGCVRWDTRKTSERGVHHNFGTAIKVPVREGGPEQVASTGVQHALGCRMGTHTSLTPARDLRGEAMVDLHRYLPCNLVSTQPTNHINHIQPTHQPHPTNHINHNQPHQPHQPQPTTSTTTNQPHQPHPTNHINHDQPTTSTTSNQPHQPHPANQPHQPQPTNHINHNQPTHQTHQPTLGAPVDPDVYR